MDRERLYRYALVLSISVIGFLLTHIFVLNTWAREDADVILAQEAHIAKLRAYACKSASATEPQGQHALVVPISFHPRK